jgi:hypothetical protein
VTVLRLIVTSLVSVAAFAASPVDVERDLLRLTNAERAKAGLPAFELEPRLTAAAREHSALMAQHKQLSHQFSGEAALSARVAKTGLRFDRVGENVSFTDYPDVAPSAHTGLMNSPPHRANILNPKYTAIGIGVVQNGDAFYITQDFAHALGAADTAAIERQVIAAVGSLRRNSGLGPMERVEKSRLGEMACRTDLSPARLFASDPAARGAVVFTTFDARELPAQLQAQVRSPRFHRFAVAACPQSTSSGGNGQFQFAVLFY